MGVEEVELRVFEVLVQELSSDDSAKEYVSFDINIPAPEYETNWCEKHEKTASMSCSTKIMYTRKQGILDVDDDEEEDDIQEQKLSFAESLAILDKIKKCYFLDDECHNMLSTVATSAC